MRSVNSVKNFSSGFLITIIVTFLGFLTRKVFVDNIGVEYLGLNGLLLNILGVMSLLEGGFAVSVVYNLYKPLADDDRPRILALLQLYRKVYRYIAVGIVLFSIIIYPFLGVFIDNFSELPNVTIVYFLFVFNSIIQYFTAYKFSLINADQKQYKLTVINLGYQIILNIAKLLILYITSSYILYLLVESVCILGLNIAVVCKVNKLYPYVVTKVKYKLDKTTVRQIVTNVKALFFNSFGTYMQHSTDNIIISSTVGLAITGLYANYTLIVSAVNSFSHQLLNSVSESVGNLIATETTEKIVRVFNVLHMMNFIVISSICIILLNTLNPFILWWLGQEYVLDNLTTFVIILNIYIMDMRYIILIFKIKSGIFRPDRYATIIQGVINLVFSLILVRYFGITGVLLGTTISLMMVNFWVMPYLVYKYVLKKPVYKYFITYVLYALLGIITYFISSILCNNISVGNGLLKVVLNGIVTLFTIVLMYLVILYKNKSFKDLLVYPKIIVKQIRER